MSTPEKRTPSVIPESPNNLQIREALRETLAKAYRNYVELYLTGGTAAAVYAGETRPLSLDLDFFVDPGAKEKIAAVFGGEFRYFGEKKLFKSDKLVAAASNGVDLDFIAEQNIVPDEITPEQKIRLHLSKLAKDKSLERNFMGENVKVLPPEMVVIAKLFAGRGIELNKYDLADSEAIIKNGIMRLDLFKRAALEIAGNDETIRRLVQNRLLTALLKLKPSREVQELIRVTGEIIGNPDIEEITDSIRRRTIPEED